MRQTIDLNDGKVVRRILLRDAIRKRTRFGNEQNAGWGGRGCGVLRLSLGRTNHHVGLPRSHWASPSLSFAERTSLSFPR